jgi:hypothetical protein
MKDRKNTKYIMVDTLIDWRPFCNEWLSTWTGNRPSDLVELYTEDIWYVDPANPTGIKGREKLSGYFEKLLSRNPDWRWEAIDIFNTENGFTLKWRATIPVKGTQLSIYGLDIVEMRGQLISRNEVYFDRVKWLEMIKVGGL